MSLSDLIVKAKDSINKSNNINDLNFVRAQFLGKNGYVSKQIKILNSLSSKVKPQFGVLINQIKKEINELFIKRKKELELLVTEKLLNTDILDITLPGFNSEIGSLHPITIVIKRIKYFFHHLGFMEAHGPEIENSYFNFDALNIPLDHPSRNKHDTFWINSDQLLRTHTSGVQIRTLSNSKNFPIRVISIGRVYRKDYDKNHTPMFHQVEGIIVGSNLNFGNLKKMLYDFLTYFFDRKITLRFRPSYFPFTEPSAEIDVEIFDKKNDNYKKKWIEILGCGIIHPVVLKNVDINSDKYSGLAFGIGIERLAMLLYEISDIRIFFENDLQFLNQFR